MNISKRWLLPSFNHQDALRISESLNVSPIVAKILCARGLSLEDAEAFLNTDDKFFYNPFLLNDMQKAVDRINSALKSKEKIAVYGDYDVDGITSTYLLFDYLKSLGADVLYYIPDRIDEGYGMNVGAIDALKKQNVTLIITVDLGITANAEVEYAKSIGVDVIITDHHELKDNLPDAVAVVNPKITGYPFDSLAGVGVAFKLIYAHSGLDKLVFDKYCDVAAIGTIADMVPLKDENRFIASKGIAKLQNVKNTGIRSLMVVAGISKNEISSSDISFVIAPRLNAAGRMSHASNSVELLLEKNDKKALEIAEELDFFNKERQKEEQKILDECIEIINSQSLFKDDFILVAKRGWAHGVIGIVSSKITDMFYKPSAVVSINDDGSAKASGRSIKGINLFDALSSCSDTLTKFGGHELAAGFTLDSVNLEKFKDMLINHVAPLMTDEIRTPYLEIDCIITMEDITIDTVRSLSELEPYGIENKAPLFCIKDIKIEDVRYTQNRKHAFVTVSKNGITHEFPAFYMTEQIADFEIGDFISVAGTLGTNTFRGVTKPQFIIKDIKYSKLSEFISSHELKFFFSDIKSKIKKGTTKFTDTDFVAVCSTKRIKFRSPKIQTALKIMSELDILIVEKDNSGYIINKGKNFCGKTNLCDSATYRKYSN